MSTSGWCGCPPLTSAPLVLVRRPRIAQAEVDVRNRYARLPVTARVGPLARPLPPGTTAALNVVGGRRRLPPLVRGRPARIAYGTCVVGCMYSTRTTASSTG